ncbi:ABC transporter permease subunit [Thermococcus sp. AM4]|uniref:ABC transporter permease subunit n=1 Tax=Thermococcus sp. (strain AM4) TaxID=246969 RepID=UPI000A060EB5|nr:ABC transporter permease subunit [Thermococcus sp. AM4]
MVLLRSFGEGFKKSVNGRMVVLSMGVFLAPNVSVFLMGKRLPLGDRGEVIKIIHAAVNPIVPAQSRDVLGFLPLFLALIVGLYSLKHEWEISSRLAYLLGRFTGHAVVLSVASFVSVITGFLILVHLGAPLDDSLLRTVLIIGALYSLVVIQLLALGYFVSAIIKNTSNRLLVGIFAGSMLLIAIPFAVAIIFTLMYAPMGELVKDPAIVREETWRYITYILPFEPTLQMNEAILMLGEQKSRANVLNLVVFSVFYIAAAAFFFSRANRSSPG